MLRANEEHIKRGQMFEQELAMMMHLVGVRFIHNSKVNKYDVDFILPDMIGVDAKWSEHPIESDYIRCSGGKQYGRHEVTWLDVNQMKWQLKQRKMYNLTEIYFVKRLEFDGELHYRVFSLGTLEAIYHNGHPRRRVASTDGTLITIFPEDTMSLTEFFKMIKGGN